MVNESYDASLPSLAAFIALFFHLLVLRRFEVDHLTLVLCGASIAICACLAYTLGLRLATNIIVSFLGTLTATILFYRAFFHPLRHFPGPFSARLSKWWAVKKTLDSNWAYYRVVHTQMRNKYGDYVRTGPRELSIFDPAAIQPILGFGTKTSKSPFYDIFETSLHVTRDRVWHRQRRKVWDTGIKELLNDFEPQLTEFTMQLIERIKRADGKPVPLSEFCINYSYDVMAALAFGRPMGFNTGQASEDANRILEIMEGSLQAFGLLIHVPWFSKAIGTLFSELGSMKLWTNWNRERLAERMAMKNTKVDLIQYLLDVTPRTPAGDLDLLGEARLIIGARSETTATNLAFILVQLGLRHEYQVALRKELAENDFSCRRSSPLLDSIINESMRLWPAVFYATQRVTPPEGLTINGHFIPGNMIVAIPPFALAKDERNFARPDEFIPERWTTKPELCINKSAFIPFLIGPYQCAGKNMAMMEMRSVIAHVIQKFEVVLPDDFNERNFFDGVKDHFTTSVPKQQVKFLPITL